jgi:hypothetical protein
LSSTSPLLEVEFDAAREMALLRLGDDKNRQPPAKPANLALIKPPETADELRARLKKQFPDLKDEELDFVM